MKTSPICVKAVVIAALVCGAPACAPGAGAQDAAAAGRDIPRVIESEQRLGAFTLGGQAFIAVARSQTISPSTDRRLATTVSELQIRDANASVIYQATFPGAIADGRFIQTTAVSASIFEGQGGRALLLRFVESPASAGTGESWQIFGVVNGRLTRFGAPLPLGQGGAAINGVLTGVMLRGGIGVVPLASTAEPLEFRVWAGNFFLHVPVRMNWALGEWSEAEQCFATDRGTLQPAGCNLRITPVRQAPAEGARITLYAQPVEDVYAARSVAVHRDSALEFPAARALVKWQNSGERFACSVESLWLRVRIDGNEGWVRSAADFAALGLRAPLAEP